ncbi:MAG: substrate-binding domain-containing protein [Patescibacteria group bacterium]|jgi:D-xylose transport system substrate-binding protein|nr:substrate-binding domain-containing protein [Patescibacteria group bacterium]
MKKILIIILLLVAAVAGIFWITWNIDPVEEITLETPPLLVGFSLGVYREERWLKDLDLFNEKVKELGAVSVSLMTDEVDVQISQIRNLISQNVKVIVIVPSNFKKLSGVIDEAQEAGIKVIAYDRLILDSDLDLYISFDSVEVGRIQAQALVDRVPSGNYAYIGGSPTDNNAYLLREGSMEVLNDKVESGEIDIVIDEYSTDWDPSVAYENIKNYLESGGELDAVVAANDGTASGVIEALREFDLEGEITVSGQDAELAACRRLVSGEQTVTVYKPIRAIAHKAAELAVKMAKGEEPEVNNNINNGYKDVPAFYIEPIVVSKDTLDETVIEDRFYSREEIYGDN